MTCYNYPLVWWSRLRETQTEVEESVSIVVVRNGPRHRLPFQCSHGVR